MPVRVVDKSDDISMEELVTHMNRLAEEKTYKDNFTTDELLLRLKYSPDFLELKRQKYHPLFVYGTLKQGERNHDYIKDMPYLGVASTVTPSFEVRRVEGLFPIMCKGHDKSFALSDYVLGELYAVTPERMLALDALEQNGYLFQRTKESFVWLHDQGFKDIKNRTMRPSVKPWIYTGFRDESFKSLPFVDRKKIDNKYFFEYDGIKEMGKWIKEEEDNYLFGPMSCLNRDKIPF